MSSEDEDALNPNHPATSAMAGNWHKIVAVLVQIYGVDNKLSIPYESLVEYLGNDDKAIVFKENTTAKSMDFELVTMEEAKKLAAEAGGLVN